MGLVKFYEQPGVVIYCGECSEILSQLEPQSVKLTITSPPYDDLRIYEGYTFDFDPIARQLWRVTDEGGVVVWVVADQTKNGSETGTSFRQALGFMELGFRLHDTMIYETNKPPIVHRRYQPCFEYMFILSKKAPSVVNLIKVNALHPNMRHSGGQRSPDGKISNRTTCNRTGKKKTKSSIWFFPRSSSSGDRVRFSHPATFPEALARDHIISWSNPGDLVLDPLCGSGTTLKMSMELGRPCVGIDISEKYCQLAVERLRQPSFWSIPDTTPTPDKLQHKPQQMELFK